MSVYNINGNQTSDVYDYSGKKIDSDGGETVVAQDDYLPRVYIDGTIPNVKADGALPVTLRFVSANESFTDYATLKVQGDSSTRYPKKNYTVKLFSDSGLTKKHKHEFKNWGKQSKFVMKANWIDLTHARNIVSARLWSDIVKSRSNFSTLPDGLKSSPNMGAVDGFPVRVFINGVYWGRYTWNIAKDAFLFGMDDELATNVALVGEGGSADASVSALFRQLAVVDESDWTDEIHDTVPQSVVDQLNRFITFVMNSSDTDFVNNFENYADLESFIDYRCFQDAICGHDSSYKNQVLITYDGLKYYASAYDMDSTFGLYWDGSSFVAVDRPWRVMPPSEKSNLLYDRLESLFLPQIKSRYSILRRGPLSETNILERFEEFIEQVPPWIVAEDYADTTANGAFTNIPSKNTNNIQQIRSYAKARLAYVDGILLN